MIFSKINGSSVFEDNLAAYDTDSLGEVVRRHGVVKFHEFIPQTLKELLHKEAEKLITEHGKRINVFIKSTGNTPRKYVSVSRNNVFDHAPSIKALYFSKDIIRFLANVTRSDVITSPYEPEQIVVNKMNETGDTHGWHWDDYSYSLVLVLAAPEPESGARVEYIDGTSWDKKASNVQHYLDSHPIHSLDLEAGSAYLLLGKRVMHRVSPMLKESARTIICFTYANEEERFTPVDHGSMEDIYK